MTKFGKYEIVEQIGHGAMGVVYKALDPLIERVVAIKTMSADLDTEPELRARFFREARAAGRLSHKNIVTIYDLGEQEGKAYMVMEFLDGEDMTSWISRRERIPLERMLRMMLDVLDGLSHAHKMGVVHRDIKPGNIFVTRSGDVKILDFGLARLASSDITRTRAVMGTPNYMSPEQIRSDVTDQRSDVFSVGATFYELLTYRKPFQASSLPATLFKIMQENPEPPEAVDPAIPRDLSTIILRAMEKDAGGRYQSAEEMAGDLERFRTALEGHKRQLRKETEDAISNLNQLLSENRDILQDDSRARMMGRPPGPASSNAGQEEVTRADLSSEIPDGYAEMVRARNNAVHDIRLVTGLLEEHKQWAARLDEAATLEQQGELQKALEIAEAVPAGLRLRPRALAQIERIREKLLEQSRKEEKRRRVARLYEEAVLCRDDDRLPESLELLGQLIALDPSHADALALRGKIAGQLEEERRRRETARKADELFEKAKLQFVEKDLRGALKRVAETLALVPEHSAARELASRIEQLLAEQKALEERRRSVQAAIDAAAEALKSGALADARRNAERALELDQESIEASRLLAAVTAAEREKQVELERKERVAVLLRQSRALVGRGADDEALQTVEMLLELDPGNSEAGGIHRSIVARQTAERERRQKAAAGLREIRAARRSGNLEAAIGMAGALAAREPDRKQIQLLLRRLEIEKARKLQEELEKRAHAITLAADKLAATNDFDQAVAVLDQADAGVKAMASFQQLQQQYRSAAKLQQQAREQAERDRKDRIRSLLKQADKAGRSGDLERAIELAQAALAEDSADVETRKILEGLQRTAVQRQQEREELERKKQKLLSRASELYAGEEFDQAISALEKSEPALLPSPEVQQLLNRCRAAAREREEARAKAERERKDRLTALLLQARASASAENFQAAIDQAKALLAADSGNREAQRILTNAEAELRARQSREALDRKVQAIVAQASRHADRQEFEAALRVLRTAGADVASAVPVKKLVAEYGRAAKRVEAERGALAKQQKEARERALRVQQHLENGTKAFEQRNDTRCLEEMDRLLALDPDHGEARNLLARSRGRLERVRAQELRARQLSDAIDSARRHLASGKLDAALELAERTLRSNPDSEEAARLRIEVEAQQAQARALQQRRSRAKDLYDEVRRLLDSSDPDAASRALKQAVSLWPESPDARKLAAKIAQRRRPTTVKAGSSSAWLRLYSPVAAGALVIAIGIYVVAHRSHQVPRPASPTVAGQSSSQAIVQSSQNAPPAQIPKATPQGGEARAPVAGAPVTNASPRAESGRPAEASGVSTEPGPAIEELRRGASEALRNTDEARSRAEQAQAGTYAKNQFDRASTLQSEAMKLYREKEFGPAANGFSQAVEAYKRAESDARTVAQARNEERIKEEDHRQADAARQTFEDTRTRATNAGVGRGPGAGTFRQALDTAAQAQRQLEQGDFSGARGRYDTASNAMQQLLGGLESERQEWEAANRDNNLPELQRFVRKYPAGTYAGQAMQQIETLEWNALSKNDAAALRGFLQKYPNGQFAHEAAKQIETAEWSAVDKRSPAALRDYAQKHPASPFATAAREDALKIEQAQAHDVDVQGVQQALTKYREAFARMDAAAVQAIWPGMSGQERRTIQDNFKETESIQIQMLPVSEPKITGDTAVVTCRRQVAQKYRHGGDASSENLITLTLRKQGGNWVIETVR